MDSSDPKELSASVNRLLKLKGGFTLKRILVFTLCVILGVSVLAIFGLGAAGCVPVIKGLSAYQGAPGAIITIDGSFFGNTRHNNRVFLGDKREMRIVSANILQIKVMVPYDDPGIYNLTVETAAGTSAPKSFTILNQTLASAESSVTDYCSLAENLDKLGYTGVDSDSIHGSIPFPPLPQGLLLWASMLWSGILYSGLNSPYAKEAHDALVSASSLLVSYDTLLDLDDEIGAMLNDSGLYEETEMMVNSVFFFHTYVRAEVYEVTGVMEGFLANLSSLIARESTDDELEKAFSEAAAAISIAREFLPRHGDNLVPKVWVDNFPDRLYPGQTYTITGYALDDLARDHANSGIAGFELEAIYVHGGQETEIASESKNIDFVTGFEEPVGQGYAYPLELQFTVPYSATSADTIKIDILVSDMFFNYDEVTYQRRINTTVRAPHLSNANISPNRMADLNALGNAQVYMEWSDADANISSLKYEFFGEGIKNRGTFTKTASSLGISGYSGSLTKRLSDLITVDNVFSSGKCYWAGMRMWLVDSQGNISDNGVVTFFLDGEGNERVFKITVGDSLNDGRNDDRFAFDTDTWYEYHLTPKGGCASWDVYLGDIPPGQNVHLTVWCIYSEVTIAGSCYVELEDGATFTGGTTRKEFNVNFSSSNPPEAEFDIIPPPEQDPPPPGS